MKKIKFKNYFVNDHGKKTLKILKNGRHSQHQISLSKIFDFGKAVELQIIGLNTLFVNKDMYLTNQLLLTATGICIYSIRRRK